MAIVTNHSCGPLDAAAWDMGTVVEDQLDGSHKNVTFSSDGGEDVDVSSGTEVVSPGIERISGEFHKGHSGFEKKWDGRPIEKGFGSFGRIGTMYEEVTVPLDNYRLCHMNFEIEVDATECVPITVGTCGAGMVEDHADGPHIQGVTPCKVRRNAGLVQCAAGFVLGSELTRAARGYELVAPWHPQLLGAVQRMGSLTQAEAEKRMKSAARRIHSKFWQLAGIVFEELVCHKLPPDDCGDGRKRHVQLDQLGSHILDHICSYLKVGTHWVLSVTVAGEIPSQTGNDVFVSELSGSRNMDVDGDEVCCCTPITNGTWELGQLAKEIVKFLEWFIAIFR
ncbi:hypothetical protein HPB50_013136 [Hyalomma asiaticum]|uniref:Uncharacterized protein n=1 Tax=Hyalomma asiaticum TaxID=266040 RepID=A0ACB7SN97_HYAAI|nr:hypothetical protein HPB50_013136 [Hyalomma asiaticum]